MSTSTPVSRSYVVHGMTCAHCALSVREEVRAVAGVSDAEVDLASVRLRVTGAHVDDRAIAFAVAQAGYEAVTA